MFRIRCYGLAANCCGMRLVSEATWGEICKRGWSQNHLLQVQNLWFGSEILVRWCGHLMSYLFDPFRSIEYRMPPETTLHLCASVASQMVWKCLEPPLELRHFQAGWGFHEEF